MKVTSTEFQQNVGRYQDAAQREPVAITKNGRTHTVLMSAAFFAMVTRGRVARPVEELDDETIKAIARSMVPPEAEITMAMQYSERLMSAAIDVVGAAKVELNQDFARNPRIVGLTILCRSISNFRAAMLLVHQQHMMEARALGRCLYENLLWIGALRERGVGFVQDMLKDEAFNRQSLGEMTLRLTKKHGADVNAPDSLTLRSVIKDIGKKFPEATKLNASKTAAKGAVEMAYVEYARLSLDGVHCSVTALGRHLNREQITRNHTELAVSVEAKTSAKEMLSTILHACRALMGVTVGANEILGFTTASDQLGALVTEFEMNGWSARAS